MWLTSEVGTASARPPVGIAIGTGLPERSERGNLGARRTGIGPVGNDHVQGGRDWDTRSLGGSGYFREPADGLGDGLVGDAEGRCDLRVRQPELAQPGGLSGYALVGRRRFDLDQINRKRESNRGSDALRPGPPFADGAQRRKRRVPHEALAKWGQQPHATVAPPAFPFALRASGHGPGGFATSTSYATHFISSRTYSLGVP